MTTQPASGPSTLLRTLLATRSLALIAAAAVALVGADVGVALSRGGSSSPSPSSGSGGPVAVVTPPTEPATPVSPAPSSTASAGGAAQQALEQLLASTFAKALAQHSVHSVARDVGKHSTAEFVDDDAQTSGIQRISIYGGHIEIRVVGTTTYFTGDHRGLQKYFNFSDAEIKALNGAWISLVSGQTGYQEVTAGITIASTLDEDLISGHLTREPDKTLDGQRVFGISGIATGTGAPKHAHATLWIGAASKLPVEYDAKNTATTLTQTFSDWGKPVRVQAPARVFGQRGLAG